MDKNLAWLTQKTEERKSNKGNFTFPKQRVYVTELQINKKVATPPFLNQALFFSFLSKHLVPSPPKVTQFFFRTFLPKIPLIKGAKGCSNYGMGLDISEVKAKRERKASSAGNCLTEQIL